MKTVWEQSDIKVGTRYRKIGRPVKSIVERIIDSEIWVIGYIYCPLKKGNLWASISEYDFQVIQHKDILKRLNSGYERV